MFRVSEARVIGIQVNHAAANDGGDRSARHRSSAKRSVAAFDFEAATSKTHSCAGPGSSRRHERSSPACRDLANQRFVPD